MTAFLFGAASIGFFYSVADAYEVTDVCATYQNTGKDYKVEANIYKCDELNDNTNSSHCLFFRYYTVIFWGPGQASVIEVDYGNVSSYGSYGKDQQGYPWRGSRSTSYCF